MHTQKDTPISGSLAGNAGVLKSSDGGYGYKVPARLRCASVISVVQADLEPQACLGIDKTSVVIELKSLKHTENERKRL